MTNKKFSESKINNNYYIKTNSKDNNNSSKRFSYNSINDKYNKSSKFIELSFKNKVKKEKSKESNSLQEKSSSSSYINSKESSSMMEANNINNKNKENINKSTNNINSINIKHNMNKSNSSNKSNKSNKVNDNNMGNSNLDKKFKDIKESLIISKRKRYNSISFLSKKNNNLYLKKNEIPEFKEYSQKDEYQKLIKIIDEENKRINNRMLRRHYFISQNYLQLFYNGETRTKKKGFNLFNKLFKKKKFIKRKTRQDITFKDFIKNEEEIFGIKTESKIESDSKDEENKESSWEARFNAFKKYINKLKKMSDEEFLKDTLKFIKQEE